MNLSKKILIVDDDIDVITFLSTVLHDNGYETVHALNGRSGLEMVKAESPDLILLDLMMPRKSGISLLADLKGDEELKKIPVIMITGVSEETGIELESFFPKSEEKGRETKHPRPDGFLEKPVDTEEFLLSIAEVLTQGPATVPPPLSEKAFYVGYRERLESKLKHKNTQISRTERLLKTLPDEQKPAFEALLEEAKKHRVEIQKELDDLFSIINQIEEK